MATDEMITTDQELNNPEKLEVIETPELTEQQLSEAQFMADQPPADIDIKEYPAIAGLSAWGARTLLKAVKPAAKEVRKKVHVIEKPLEDIVQKIKLLMFLVWKILRRW